MQGRCGVIEKWELSYAPTGKDRGRFKVRFRGKAEEIQQLIQKLPVNCEKPFYTLSQDYDCAIFVHLLSESEKNQLIQTLQNVSPNGEIVDPDVQFQKNDSELNAFTGGETFQVNQEFSLNSFPLDPGCTFEKFAVCAQNRFAHAAAVAIAESPGKIYNPLLLCGKSGTGKSHLIQAVAHRMVERNPESKFLLITADHFKEKISEAIQSRKRESFHAAFEELDLLLLDDIEVLAGQTVAERELLFFLNLLLAQEKQLVFTSKLPLRQMVQLDEKLRLRLESGLVIELPAPFAETRMTILKKQSEEMQLELEPEVLTYLSDLPCDSIDELQGILKKIHAHIHLQKGKTDLSSIKNLIETPASQETVPEVSPHPWEITSPQTELLSPQQEAISSPKQQDLLLKDSESFSKQTPTSETTEVAEESSSPDSSRIPTLHKGETVRQKILSAPEKKPEKPAPLKPIPESELAPVKMVCFYPKDAKTEWDNAREKLNAVIRKYRLKFKLIGNELSYDPESDLKFSFFSETCKTQENSIGVVLGTPAGSALEKKAFFAGLQKHFAAEKISLYFLPWSERVKDQKLLSFALDISLNLKKEP